MQVDEDNLQFQKAVALVNHTERDVFLTGKAGTGKTTFLKYIKAHSYKKLAVVAPTGVAAINAGGVTIHSLFQLPLGTYIANKPSGWGEPNGRYFNTQQLLGNLRIHKKKRELLRELDLLIIDEISMVRADVLDAVDMVLRHIRRKHHQPFGGLQVIYIGDLFQLPPVVKDEEWEYLKTVYEGPFFFHSKVIRERPPIYLELEKIYRQEDKTFISLLNKIRNNQIEEEDLEFLEQFYQPYFMPDGEDGYITLTTHNFLADRINKRELAQLDAPVYELKARVKDLFPASAFPAQENLELKGGAQIMFIRNDKGQDRRYFNGKMGMIEEIDTVNDKLLIRFPHEKELLELGRETWENVRYQYDEEKDAIKENVIGTFKQFPVQLAWAVTIHKSQGLTFEKAVIDAGRAFAPGQVYVALSRLTSLEGLVLKSVIQQESILTDERVLAFVKQKPSTEELDQLLDASRDDFLKKSLVSAFDWDNLTGRITTLLQSLDKKKASAVLSDTGPLAEMEKQLLHQKKISQRFCSDLVQCLDQKDFERLNQRIQAAVQWFAKELKGKAILPLNHLMTDLKEKYGTKKKINQLKIVLQILEYKITDLQQAQSLSQTLLQPGERGKILRQAENILKPKAIKQPKKVKREKGDSKRYSLSLFRSGSSIESIADQRGLKSATITNHLISYIPTGEVRIEDLFEKELIEKLTKIITAHKELSPSQIRDLTGQEYSYAAIKACMLSKKVEIS